MHRPFTILEEWVKQGRIRLVAAQKQKKSEPIRAREERKIKDATSSPSGSDPSDAEIFKASMQDVLPLDRNEGPARVAEPVAIRPNRDEEEALRVLEEFCRSGRVELVHTREYVEHVAQPIGRLDLDDLRTGRFAIQSHLDLHGMTLEQARPALDSFIAASVRAGYSCVRVVHGRGHHSEGKRPLMKWKVEQYLSHRRLARFVIAYTSARLVDGG
jgi:DNA-nicking Smr family endonuclease